MAEPDQCGFPRCSANPVCRAVTYCVVMTGQGTCAHTIMLDVQAAWLVVFCSNPTLRLFCRVFFSSQDGPWPLFVPIGNEPPAGAKRILSIHSTTLNAAYCVLRVVWFRQSLLPFYCPKMYAWRPPMVSHGIWRSLGGSFAE